MEKAAFTVFRTLDDWGVLSVGGVGRPEDNIDSGAEIIVQPAVPFIGQVVSGSLVLIADGVGLPVVRWERPGGLSCR
jgi:hypothetical protein